MSDELAKICVQYKDSVYCFKALFDTVTIERQPDGYNMPIPRDAFVSGIYDDQTQAWNYTNIGKLMEVYTRKSEDKSEGLGQSLIDFEYNMPEDNLQLERLNNTQPALPSSSPNENDDGIFLHSYMEPYIQAAIQQERERGNAEYELQITLNQILGLYHEFDQLLLDLEMIAELAYGKKLAEKLVNKDIEIATAYSKFKTRAEAVGSDVDQAFPDLQETVDTLIKAIQEPNRNRARHIREIIAQYLAEGVAILYQPVEPRDRKRFRWRYLLGSLIHEAKKLHPKWAYWQIANLIEANLYNRCDLNEDETSILKKLRERSKGDTKLDQILWKQDIKEWFRKVLADYRKWQ